MATAEQLRRSREQTSIFRPLFERLREERAALAAEGRRPVLGGLLSKEPVMGTDTIRYEGIGPMLRGILDPIARGVDAPRAAAAGLIPNEDMASEAFGTAGVAMGGSAAHAGRGILDYDPNTTRVFAGRRAAARVGGNRRASMRQAQDLFEQGASNRSVHEKTGVFKGVDGKLRFEVDDSRSLVRPDVSAGTKMRLEDYLDHPELFELYPTMRGAPVEIKAKSEVPMGYEGSFLPHSGGIELTRDTPEKMKRVLLHEIQHSVQQREGFSGGSSPQDNYSITQARNFADAVLSSPEGLNKRQQSENFDFHARQAQPLFQAQYIDKLDNIVAKSGEGRSKPSDIHRLSDWYKYSDDIRRDIGVMPSRAGPERDSWIATAARKIKGYNLSEMSLGERDAYNGVMARFSTPRDRKNALSRVERLIDKNREGHFAYRNLVNRAKSAQEHDAMQAYLREAGEVEARNVATRYQPRAEGDSQSPALNRVFPFDTADFSPEEQIISNLRVGDNLTDVKSMRRLDPKLAAAIRRGLLE